MTTTPPQDPPNIPYDPLTSANVEYHAAFTAYQTQLTLMNPTSQRYQDLFFKHKQIQARHISIMEKMASHRSNYQRHKQHVITLTNALLQSNTALQTAAASNAVTHDQVLTQATLANQLNFASETLVKMIMKNKRFDKANTREYTREEEIYNKCRDMLETVERECRELDRLHANVLEAGAKIGRGTECGKEDGRCISCRRNKMQEARRVAAEKAEAERAIEEERGRVKGGMSKAARAKQMLEAILEEDESQDGANA